MRNQRSSTHAHSHERRVEKGYLEVLLKKQYVLVVAQETELPVSTFHFQVVRGWDTEGGQLTGQGTGSGCLGGEWSQVEAASEGDGDQAVPSLDSALKGEF